MEEKYSCIKCDESLVKDGIIVIDAELRSGTRGKLELHQDPIEDHIFNIEHDEIFEYEPDLGMDHLDLFCPHCDESMAASKETNNLNKMVYTDANRLEFEVFFSRLRFERFTYMKRRKEVEVTGKNLYSDHLKKILYRKYGMLNTRLTPR